MWEAGELLTTHAECPSSSFSLWSFLLEVPVVEVAVACQAEILEVLWLPTSSQTPNGARQPAEETDSHTMIFSCESTLERQIGCKQS